MSTYRIDRLQSEIRDLASRIFLFEIQDSRIRDVRVTRVMLTRDLGLARIYYDLPAGKDRKPVAQALKHVGGYFRKAVAKALQIRLTPQIEFYYDETSEEGRKIEELFSKIQG